MSSISPFSLPTSGSERILFSLPGANMNSTADQALTRAFTFTNFLITRVRVVNASQSLILAAGGIYNAVTKGGSPLVAAAQTYSALTSATLGLDLTLTAAALGLRVDADLYISLTVAQAAPATADFYIFGTPLT